MRIGPIYIEKMLPGELDGTLDPRDYGFEVIKDTRPEEEALRGAAQLYRSTRARTGTEMPKLDHLLELQTYDPEPARQLAAKHEALQYPYICEFGGATLTIDEGVFVPTLTKVSSFLLRNVDFKPGETVLDAFAGSGAFGVIAALRGSEAVSFDNSEAAASCAQKNAEQNNVAEQVKVRLGTLREAITPAETFDLITANPPLIPSNPQKPLESALFDNGLQTTTDFIAALPELLAKHGRCYLATSDVIDRNNYKVDIAKLCRDNGLAFSTVDQLHLLYESYRIHKITRRTPMTGIKTLLRKAAKIL